MKKSVRELSRAEFYYAEKAVKCAVLDKYVRI